MSAFYHEVKAVLPVHLHPSKLGNTNEGVFEALNAYLMRYNEDVNGVVLCYSDTKIKQETGRIFFERPHIHFSVEAKLLIYQPEVGASFGSCLLFVVCCFCCLCVFPPSSLFPHSFIPIFIFRFECFVHPRFNLRVCCMCVVVGLQFVFGLMASV